MCIYIYIRVDPIPGVLKDLTPREQDPDRVESTKMQDDSTEPRPQIPASPIASFDPEVLSREFPMNFNPEVLSREFGSA